MVWLLYRSLNTSILGRLVARFLAFNNIVVFSISITSFSRRSSASVFIYVFIIDDKNKKGNLKNQRNYKNYIGRFSGSHRFTDLAVAGEPRKNVAVVGFFDMQLSTGSLVHIFKTINWRTIKK